MKRTFATLFTSAAALMSTSALAAPEVVASIKPIHSLVSQVMQGVGEPTLLVDGAASPHQYSLKPSQARSLSNADVVFWVGDDIEAFLSKPLASLSKASYKASLMDIDGILRLKYEEEGHDEHTKHDEHKDHDEHAHHDEHTKHDDHKKHDEHDAHGHHHEHDHHDDHAKHDEHETHEGHEDHGHHDHHHHGEYDPHIWLDPQNAVTLINHIAAVLSEIDADNAKAYQANAAKSVQQLSELSHSIEHDLEDAKVPSFVVFHDAYAYFENRYGLNASGVVTVNPELAPSAQRVRDIRADLSAVSAACLFSEPQFTPKVMATIAEGLSIYQGVLDPLGAELSAGPDLYPTLINNMAASFKACAAHKS